VNWWWPFRRKPDISSDDFHSLISRVPLASRYETTERARLLELTRRLLAKKAVEGAGSFEVTAHVRRVIAVQACIPILNLGLDWYRGWVSIVVYPSAFVARHEHVDGGGVVHRVHRALSGESWDRGPVIVSWHDAEQAALGRLAGNVVIHEFAHKLDALNGVANGMPPLHAGMARKRWTEALTSAYEDLCRRIERAEPLPLDPYATQSPAEFFAVASEAFFVRPEALTGFYPEVYRQLSEFYRQDPAARPIDV
jgi:Mlc titration factor MtfA (ptsG expression regulator)